MGVEPKCETHSLLSACKTLAAFAAQTWQAIGWNPWLCHFQRENCCGQQRLACHMNREVEKWEHKPIQLNSPASAEQNCASPWPKRISLEDFFLSWSKRMRQQLPFIGTTCVGERACRHSISREIFVRLLLHSDSNLFLTFPYLLISVLLFDLSHDAKSTSGNLAESSWCTLGGNSMQTHVYY